MDRLSALFGEATSIDSLVSAIGIDKADHKPDDVALLLVERSPSDG
jgi:hypothetical protein